jgi:hypothetical protein
MTDQPFAQIEQIAIALLRLSAPVILVMVILFFIQDGMIFLGINDTRSREFLRGLPNFHEVSFTSENGKTYHGIMHRTNDEAAPLIIYFGGNGECAASHMRGRENRGEWGIFAGFHYMVVDYEGYGLNGGRTHYLNMYEHALAVYDFAITLPYVDSSRIVVMAFSLGTGGAVHLAANRHIAGLILATPYASGYDLYNNVIPIFHGPLRLLVKHKFPSYEYAPMVSSPTMIIASRRDEMIPFASSERLAALFPGDVEFISLENVTHNQVFQVPGIYGRIQNFLARIP